MYEIIYDLFLPVKKKTFYLSLFSDKVTRNCPKKMSLWDNIVH